jgi:hypothetical protein
MSRPKTNIHKYLVRGRRRVYRRPRKIQQEGFGTTLLLAYLKHIVNNVKLDRRLSFDAVIHSARIELHQNEAAADDHRTL